MATANELEARRRKNEEELNFYATPISAETLEIVRRRLAKRANQRLVRLERSESKISGEAYHIGAYDMAQEYLREAKNTDKKRLRFSENLSQRGAGDFDTNEEYRQYLLYEVAKIQSFLSAKSSTVKGNRAIEEKRIATFTDKEHGLSASVVSTKGFYDFITSAAYKYLDARAISSDKLQELYDYYTDADAERVRPALKAEDFQKVADEYESWLTEPAQAKHKVSLKELSDKLDAFMIASSGYNTEQLEKHLIETGVYTEEDIKKLKK